MTAASTQMVGFTLALLFAAVHLYGGKLRALQSLPRSRWLSLAGGASVAYVFVHLLPELAHYQERMRETGYAGEDSFLEHHVYLIALAGLTIYYCLEQVLRRHAPKEKHEKAGKIAGFFWLHLAFFAVYNIVIGYLLIRSEGRGLTGLLLYGIAMALHLLTVDNGLKADHGQLYDRRGRWLLALAPVFGALLASFTEVHDLVLIALVGFIGGSVILNVLKEELPEDRQASFGAFLGGAAGYTALLIAAG